MSVGCTRGCPARVRPGTPPCLCGLCCRCIPRPSLGVQGALVARLLDPLPLGRPGLFARVLAKARRSLPLATPQGQGLSPLHPDEPLDTEFNVVSEHPCGFVLADGASKLAPPRALCVVLSIVPFNEAWPLGRSIR